MSDFLGHLVARTLAQPTLRPRTRSRFEAPSIEEAPLIWPEATPPAQRDLERDPARPTALASPAQPSPPSQSSRTSPAATTTRQAEERRRPAGWPGGVPPPPEARTLPAPTQTHAEAPPAQEPERIAIETRREPREHRHDRQPPRIIERRGPREIEEVHRERVIRTNTNTQRILSRTQQVATPNAEPTIQVSIGRIEVRAVPSAPPSRTAPRSGAMTIDDYVARRKAKERR
jgi:hypothetical protein